MSEAANMKLVSLVDDTDWKLQQEIPEEDANQTFKELGIESINIKRIRGYRKIADILKKIGMVEYERGRLMHREAVLEAARMAMVEIVLGGSSNDHKIAAAQTLNILTVSENKTAELNIRLEELAAARTQERKLAGELPPAGLNVGLAVQVNVDREEKETTVTGNE